MGKKPNTKHSSASKIFSLLAFLTWLLNRLEGLQETPLCSWQACVEAATHRRALGDGVVGNVTPGHSSSCEPAQPSPQILLNASFLGFRSQFRLVLVRKVRDGIVVFLPCISLHM